ncbi:hypothetical protein AALD22_24015 [Lachnospiraceae bacterium 56-18]
MKKEISTFLPDRKEDIGVVTEKILSVFEEYNVSALDFLEIMKHTKKEGLKRFQL